MPEVLKSWVNGYFRQVPQSENSTQFGIYSKKKCFPLADEVQRKQRC